MKNFTLLLISLFISNVMSAQLNMTYKSEVTYNEALNDIWGYAAPDGREYALVGLRNGVSVVDVTDTENPEIKGYADGPSSTWRDMKTFGTFAYVTNETGDGLLVIDLSNLPNQLTDDDYWYWAPEIAGQTLGSCHNIYIDEVGYAYLVGCEMNQGGPIYVDVFTNPGSPEFVALGPSVYAHDIYVRDNITYNSEIYVGAFTAYDVSDKLNTVTLGSQQTPFNFTHNAWLSDDSNFLFTTDEQADAPVGSYDVSDLNNIQEVDQFRPIETLGEGVIPHNVHVWNDWIIISYYTDGCIIVDGSRPSNLIEVANFDTFIPASTGFSGAWGAYPFLPSGTVLVSDIGNGMYVLEPNYVRACWLEGNVTDINTGADISGVTVEIAADQANEGSTANDGFYATGIATSGTYDITFSHPAYESLTVPADLINGEVTILDVQLGALASQAFSGQVIEEGTGTPISGAKVFIQGEAINYELDTDVDGNFAVTSLLEGDYTIYAGSWGHVNNFTTSSVSGGPGTAIIELAKGYADDFIVDLEWTVQSTASAGIWERGEPIGTTFNGGIVSNPDEDAANDLGDLAYITGNDGGTAGNDDVDNGYTRLTSPVMDLSTYNQPIVKFEYWFFNGGGNNDPNDNLTVRVKSGFETVDLTVIIDPAQEWQELELDLVDLGINLTDDMNIIFESSDQLNDNDGHLTEAGVDAFLVFDANPTATFEVVGNVIDINASPNPFSNSLNVSYKFEAIPNQATLNVFNILGQQVESIRLDNIAGNVEINTINQAGIYFLQIEADGSLTSSLKVIKQ